MPPLLTAGLILLSSSVVTLVFARIAGLSWRDRRNFHTSAPATAVFVQAVVVQIAIAVVL